MSRYPKFTIHHSPFTIHHCFFTRLRPHLTLDTLLSLLLFLLGLYAYTATLAPSVLEGDGALFQYTPYVLGVTYPTGFPLYILLGKLWVTIFPLGDIAWRMNFLSALCSAFTLPFLYNSARYFFAPHPAPHPNPLPQERVRVRGVFYPTRWAALVTTLTYATLPTFWLWSTGTKTYALNILILNISLYLLAKILNDKKTYLLNFSESAVAGLPTAPGAGGSVRRPALACPTTKNPLSLPALLLGLQISIHNTAVLLAPGLILLAWLHFAQHLQTWKARLTHLLLIGLPGLFYLYIPLRAQWLISQYGRLGAIERGLLADFYQPGWAGLIRYYTAADFTSGVVTNWSAVPGQFLSRYLPILIDNFTMVGVILGLSGGLAFALWQFRLFLPLFLIYVIPIPIVLAYGQGEQSAFLLPSFLIFALFIGYVLLLPSKLGLMISLDSKLKTPLQLAAPLLFLLFLPLIAIPQTRYNLNWLDVKWSRPTHDEWADNLNHPLEPGATILARWGDLTSFWYMQYGENRRPDLKGLYPPQEETVLEWFNRGGQNLYIAGPLEEWTPGVEERYQLLPWGRLVRLAPRTADPQAILPDLPYHIDQIFAEQLHLLAVDVAPQVIHGNILPITLTWQALADLPPETTISLRLAQGDTIITQIDDPLLSAWFPRETLPPDQYLLSYPLLPVPLGVLPGKYRLQMVAYTSYKQPWPLTDGNTLLDLGEVEIILPSPDFEPDTDTFETIPGHDFNGEIRLAHYEYTARRVGQGKGFAVKMLWQALTPPVDNYTLLLEVVDNNGQVIRSIKQQPVAGRAPTSTWQPNQFIRDQVDIVLPASTPIGADAIQVRLSWQRPDGSLLDVRRYYLPLAEQLTLAGLEVTEKEDRTFAIPSIQYPVQANLDNKIRLLGYSIADSGLPQISLDVCNEDPAKCQLPLEIYWQGISEMEQLYFVFLHVVDAEGNIVAQHDRAPGKRGKQPTTSWLPEEVVTDPVTLQLPPDLPPGEYTLRLGLYLPPSGPRLLTLDPAGQPLADFVDIGTLKLIP